MPREPAWSADEIGDRWLLGDRKTSNKSILEPFGRGAALFLSGEQLFHPLRGVSSGDPTVFSLSEETIARRRFREGNGEGRYKRAAGSAETRATIPSRLASALFVSNAAPSRLEKHLSLLLSCTFHFRRNVSFQKRITSFQSFADHSSRVRNHPRPLQRVG